MAHDLMDDEKEHAAMQVDAFVRILAERYGIEPHEIVESVRWVQERRRTIDRMRSFAAASLIGTIISAMLVLLWEGFKEFGRRP